MEKKIDFFKVVDYPLMTEKAVNMIEKENKLVFVLKKRDFTKKDVKQVVEEEFKVKVEKVNTLIDRKGKKRAIVKLKKEFSAQDIATKLGII